MRLPEINLRRTYLIARRDFFGYVKTVGFWLSFLLPFLFGAFGVVLSQLKLDVDPVRYEAVLDETGQHAQALQAYEARSWQERERQLLETILERFLSDAQTQSALDQYDQRGVSGLNDYLEQDFPALADRIKFPQRKRVYVPLPAENLQGLTPYIVGDKDIIVDGQPQRLNGVLHIYDGKDDQLRVDYWSANINETGGRDVARRYFKKVATDQYLALGGLSAEGLEQARADNVDIDIFDPSKMAGDDQGQAVTIEDKIPFLVAGGLSLLLWLSIFSGSYMLLTSMVEEKQNKLLEMMLASTRFSEIIFGKLLGVAALTIAAMLPYIFMILLTIIIVLTQGDPIMIAGIKAAFSPKLIIFFFIFLILGYLFYGALFIALGSLTQSMQDAQTITTPVMLILTGCILIVPLGIKTPDAPIVAWASWFPLSAPFGTMVRLPLEPPVWEMVLSAAFLFILTLGVVWLAGRAFRYGVFAAAGFSGFKDWALSKLGRNKLGQNTLEPGTITDSRDNMSG